MTALVGHERVRDALEKSMPRVTLLIGPSGTGKSVLARHVIERWRERRGSVEAVFFGAVDADQARRIVREAAAVPPGAMRFFVAELDGSSEQAQNILLKVLEEPPDPVWFVLLSSRNLLPTVVSRAQVYWTGLLTGEQVAEVLTRLGVPDARRHALEGGGTVTGALEAARRDSEEVKRVRAAVSAVLRAAAGRDWEGASRSMRGWGPEHGALFMRWSAEAATGQWKEFSAAFAPGFTGPQALAAWRRLRADPESRNLAVSALQEAVRAG